MSEEFRPIFKINEADHGFDSLEATVYRNTITIVVEEPMAGDTETGFGQTTSISVSPDGAEALARWLLWAADRARTGRDAA